MHWGWCQFGRAAANHSPPLTAHCSPLTALAPPHTQRELRALQLRLAQLQSASVASLGPGAAAAAGGAPGELAVEQQQPQPAAGPPGELASHAVDMSQLAFPLRPVGVLRSCFSRRNGTPRQPLLVPAARARLTLRPGLSAEFLDGLTQYRRVIWGLVGAMLLLHAACCCAAEFAAKCRRPRSPPTTGPTAHGRPARFALPGPPVNGACSHVWLLYVFHENTDLQRLWQGDPDSGLRAKIRCAAAAAAAAAVPGMGALCRCRGHCRPACCTPRQACPPTTTLLLPPEPAACRASTAASWAPLPRARRTAPARNH